LLADISTAVGVKLDPLPDRDDTSAYAEIIEDRVSVALYIDGSNHLLDEDGMPFSSHPHQVKIRPLDTEEQLKTETDRIYSELKETGRYSMFSSFDLQYPLRRDIVD
jgi:hypothetical protein